MQEIFWRADDADVRIPQTPMSLSSRARIFKANYLVCVLSCQSKSLVELVKEFRRDFITAVAIDAPENTKLVIVFQQRLAGLFELLQTSRPSLWTVIVSLNQRFTGDIIFAVNLGCIEGSVVYSTGCGVDPAIADAIEDDRSRSIQLDNKVDGNHLVELNGLIDGAGEAIQDERGIGLVAEIIWALVGGCGSNVIVLRRCKGVHGVERRSDRVHDERLLYGRRSEPSPCGQLIRDQAQDGRVGDKGACLHKGFGLDA